MMGKLMTALAVVAVALMLIEHFSWELSHDKVKRRQNSGDYTCGVKKTWWGWRVREYGEDRL